MIELKHLGKIYSSASGSVEALKGAAGGIVGKTSFGALFGCQNFGTLNVTSTYTGGIAGWVGNYTVANYCFNGGTINDSGNRSTGGIIGEAGDAREWTGMDIADVLSARQK